jgi:hypothetical protein
MLRLKVNYFGNTIKGRRWDNCPWESLWVVDLDGTPDLASGFTARLPANGRPGVFAAGFAEETGFFAVFKGALPFFDVFEGPFLAGAAFFAGVLLVFRLIAGFRRVFLIAPVFFEADEAVFLVFTVTFFLDDGASRAAGLAAVFFEEAGFFETAFFEEFLCVFFAIDLAAPLFIVPPKFLELTCVLTL